MDVRSSTYSDSVVIQNTTFFGLTDRVIRNQLSQVGYTLIDHCTGWTTQGFHGYLELSNTHQAVITNNLFYNPLGMGSRFFKNPNALSEQNQPAPENQKFWVVSLDNLYPDSKFAIKNNNIVWEQRFFDLWAQADSVEAPGTITPTLLGTLNDPAKAYFSELVTFKKLPPNNPDGTSPDPYVWIQAYLQNRTLSTYPENWFFGVYTDFDFSYGTTAQSYTAAAGGFPLGDLNWYPDRKAAWIAAGMPTSVADAPRGTPNTFELSQNYPNPFNPETQIAYKLAKTSRVSLEIFNALGQKVRTLVQASQPAGSHDVTWNGLNDLGASVPTGVYFYRLQVADPAHSGAGAQTMMKKMVLLR